MALNNTMRIRCHTLYDITKTNINSRRQGLETGIDPTTFNKQRSQQSNFETILQIIGMRSQPEDISESTKYEITLTGDSSWGYVYTKNKSKKAAAWRFDFSVSHSNVFNNGIQELGNLIQDCAGVPMIVGLDETIKLSNQINTDDELRNIYFEVIDA